ncbi:hypothetical protein [Spirosoma areae]
MPGTARLLPIADSLATDLQQGLRYTYAGRLQTLPWRTTFDELAKLPFVQQTGHHAYGWPVLRLNVPVRLGRLEVEGIEINDPVPSGQSTFRRDVPIDHYPLEIRLVDHGADNYWLLKACLSQTLGNPRKGWERDDQLHAGWQYDGLSLGLTYWFRSVSSRQESGHALLTIDNNRVYPDYLTDDYVGRFSLDALASRYQTFQIPHVVVPHNYRTSRFVRFTPGPIQELLQGRGHNLAVWFDAPRHSIGVAQPDYALIVPVADAARFALARIDHDRGVYSDELQLHAPNRPYQTLIDAGVDALHPVAATVQAWGFSIERVRG